ncbi:MAG: hypothetical protein ACYDD0_10850, partial [Candidatus Dormibacteria bacterium]
RSRHHPQPAAAGPLGCMRVPKPLVVGAVATVLACAIGFQLSLLGSSLPVVALATPFVVAIGMAAAVWLQRPALGTASTGLLLLSYGLDVTGQPGSGLALSTVGLVAGGAFLALQLGWWAVELRTPAHEDRPAMLREGARIGAAAAGFALAAEGAVLLTRIPVGSGIIVVLVGVASLAAIVVVAVVLGASQAPPATAIDPSVWLEPVPSRSTGRQPTRWSKVRGRALQAAKGAPLTTFRRRSRQSMATTTGLSLLLLAVAALVVLTALNPVTQPSSTVPAAVRSADITATGELAVLVAGAIVLNWLVRLLLQLSRPALRGVLTTPRRPDAPDLPAELELIAHACRNVSSRARLTGELQRMLVSLATQVGAQEIASQFELGATPATTLNYPGVEARDDMRRGSFGPGSLPRFGDGKAEASVGTALAALEASCDV